MAIVGRIAFSHFSHLQTFLTFPTPPIPARIASDEKGQALELLRDVLAKAYGRMADDATCLIFT